MELGGNAPFLVFADADIDAAVAEGAMIAKLRHNGEACTAANRFFVEAPVADEFGPAWPRPWRRNVGPGLDPDTRLGPLVDAAGRDKVERLVQAGVDGGGPGAHGRAAARRAEGLLLRAHRGHRRPAATRRCWPRRCSARSPRSRPSSRRDVVARANDVEHGLVAYLYTGDLARGMTVPSSSRPAWSA